MRKQKLKNYLKFGILLFGISILLWNCEEETFEPINELSTEQNNTLDFKIENLTFKQANLEPIFSDLRIKFDIEEPIFNTEKGTYFSKTNSSKSSNDTFTNINASVDMGIVRKITTSDYTSYTMRLIEPQNSNNSFSNVVIQENNGVEEVFTVKYTPTKQLRNGETQAFEGDFTLKSGIIPYDGWDDEDDNTGGGNDWVEICNDVIVLVPHACSCKDHMPWQSCTCPDQPYYTLETKQECYWDYEGSTENTGDPNTDTGDSNNNTGGGSSTPSTGDGDVITTPISDIIPEGADPVEWFDDQIFIDEEFINNPCLKSVYDVMGKASTFENYLKNFDADASVANLRFTADDNFANNYQDYVNAMAITTPPLSSNTINIVFNTDSNTIGNILDKPDLFKAVTMIHEIIHAEMYRKMLEAIIAAENLGTTLDWTNFTSQQFDQYLDSLENKYFGIFDYYTRYDLNDDTPDNGQHQQMAEHYRDIIKQALTDYDPTLTDDQKEALSWIGLNEANIVAWQNYQNKDLVNNTLTTIKNTFPNGCN